MSLHELINRQYIQVIKFGEIIPCEKILIIAPHSDDEVIGCGGTIIKYANQNIDINIIYLTDGKYGVFDENTSIRREEAISAWSNYPGITLNFFDFEDSSLKKNLPKIACRLKEYFYQIKPNIIFVPWFMDKHTDHQYTALAIIKAVEKFKFAYIISYEVFYPLYSNFFVNITKVMQKKIDLLEYYKSQNPDSLKKICLNLNKFRASEIKLKAIQFVESFFITKLEYYKKILKKYYMV